MCVTRLSTTKHRNTKTKQNKYLPVHDHENTRILPNVLTKPFFKIQEVAHY